MKANPSIGILTLFRELGLHIDASSDYEVERAIRAGFAPCADPADLADAVAAAGGARRARACSSTPARCTSSRRSARSRPAASVSVRMNPGLGSGGTNRTNTGGPASSFGIWHEYLGEVKAIAERHDSRSRGCTATSAPAPTPRSGSASTRMTLDLVGSCPTCATVNLGGGFKVGRMPGEPSTDLQDVGAHVQRELIGFQDRDGRRCTSRSSPARTWSPTPARSSRRCIDVVDTGRDGYLFAKLDTGMTEVTRPSLYGAQHPIDVLAEGREEADVVFVGPCCESGDILTPAPGDPEALAPRRVPRPADRRPGGRRRRRRLLRRDVDDQLQLVPAGARGDAGAGRHAPAAAPAPGARAGLGERGVSR